MLAYVLVLAVIIARIAFRPLAFAPVAPALLFFGAYMPRKRAWIPLVALAAADLYLTVSSYSYPLTADVLVSWGWYAAVLFGGAALLKHQVRPVRVAGAGLAASISFFLASNFAVWAVWNMYPKTLGGLVDCYVAAVPFFRNTLAGDLFFSAVLFGIGALVSGYASEKAHGRIAA